MGNYKKRKVHRYVLMVSCFLTLIIFLLSCKEDFNGYYDPPGDLAGPIYEQLSNDPDFSEFTKALDKLTVLKGAINTSGLYTVFVPTNEAMTAYYNKIGKSSIDDFDMLVEADSVLLSKLVNSHILFNMYFKYNFDKLIDETEDITQFRRGQTSNDQYRFGSRFREADYIVYDKLYEKNRTVRPGYKVLSVYTDKYIDKYKMGNDYKTLYGNTPGDFNIDGVQVLEDKRDIAAKNGVIHGINKVIESTPTIDVVLKEKNPYFSNLFENFVTYSYDEQNINGFDTIFYKDYQFIFNFASDNNVGTVLCPEVGAFNDFVNDVVLPKFDNSFDTVPSITAQHLLSPYILDISRRWKDDVADGIVNFIGDTLVNTDITESLIASNGLVYVTPELILSSAFETVVKVPMLDKKYSWFLDLLSNVTNTGYIEILSYKNANYTFLVPTNEALETFGVERFSEGNGEYSYYLNGLKMFTRTVDTLVNSLIFQEQVFDPAEQTYAWKQTRNGHFVLFENGKINNEITSYDKEESDNGLTYSIGKIPGRPAQTITSYLTQFEDTSIFVSILKRWFADQLSESTTGETTGETMESLLTQGDATTSFTVLVPSDAALQAYKTNNGLGGFTVDSVWQDIAQYHIITTRLFSEGSFERKADNPLPVDQTKFNTLCRDIVYSPGNIFEKDHFAWIQKVDGSAKVKDQSGNEANIVSGDIQAKNGVVHHIDNVLTPPARTYPDND